MNEYMSELINEYIQKSTTFNAHHVIIVNSMVSLFKFWLDLVH